MTEKMLKTWKQIGKFLGMSERTCQRRYKDSKKGSDPMPLYINGTVRGFPEELREWKERQKGKLTSMKEIADFMVMSVPTLYRKRQQSIEKGDPIPVKGGQAYPEELKAWLRRQ